MWIIVMGAFLALWSAAELALDLSRGSAIEARDLVFLVLGVAIAIGESRGRGE